MRKHYGHRITKRERAAIDVLYGPFGKCYICSIVLTMETKQAVPSHVNLCAGCWQKQFGSIDRAQELNLTGAFNPE